KRIDPRPEDNPISEVDDGAGEYGHYAPWSWWPLGIGIGVTFAFGGAAAGWGRTGIGLGGALGGLVGHGREGSGGPHAHGGCTPAHGCAKGPPPDSRRRRLSLVRPAPALPGAPDRSDRPDRWEAN